MMSCNHIWIGNRGSNDKPCTYCARYPALYLRYQCTKCMIESCSLCLTDNNQTYDPVPPPIKQDQVKHKTLELRILQLENTLHMLQEKTLFLELELQQLKLKNIRE